MFVLDTNILVHLGNSADPKHEDVQRFVRNTVANRELVAIPWIAALGYLRISTNPRIQRTPPTMGQAISILQSWLAQPNVVLIEPGPRHLAILAELAADRVRCDPTDLHIAALAIERDATVVTYDRDFGRFDVPVVRPN